MITPPRKPFSNTYVRAKPLSIVLLTLATFLAVSCDSGSSRVLIEDLTAPRGLTHAGDAVLIAEGGAGRILRYDLAAETVTELASRLPVTLDAGPGGNTAAGVTAVVEWPGGGSGALAVAVGEYRGGRFSRLYVLVPGAEPEGITPLSEPMEPGGLVNPYDLALLGDDFIVSDPGANALWRVTPDGEVLRYADFPDIGGLVEDRGVEVVPTGMHLAADGTIYVASLTGYPYPPGVANVYAVRDLNDDGDALDAGEVEVAATGFTAATDVAVVEGGFLVTEYSRDMRTLVEEHGVDEAAEVPGSLVRWQDGEIEHLADLVSPTSVLVDRSQDSGPRALVSEEFPGRIVAVALSE